MSSAGIRAEVYSAGQRVGDALMIGARVPRIHHSDGIPVYLVVEHPQGAQITLTSGQVVKLLAYPSAWPSPGRRGEGCLYAHQEVLPWNAPIPLFDQGDA